MRFLASQGVDISEQIVRIEMEVKQQPNVDALRPGIYELRRQSAPGMCQNMSKFWYIHIVLGPIPIVEIPIVLPMNIATTLGQNGG